MNGEYIKIKDAALQLGVSKLTLRNWDKNGKLRAYRHPINNYRVYKIEDMRNIIQRIKIVVKEYVPKEKKPRMIKDEYASKMKIFTLKTIRAKN